MMDKQERLKIMVNAFINDEFNSDMKGKLLKSDSKRIQKDFDSLFDYCLNKAWNDTMAYERFKSNSEVRTNANKIKQRLKDEFICNHIDYNQFNLWHKKMCENSDDGMTCGLWQKFINMTFKYLYCVKQYGYDWNIDFTRCHMPLDSYTLRWYYKKYPVEEEQKIVWNNLKLEDYLQIRDNIANIVPSQYTPLQYEFFVWPIEIMCKADDFAKHRFISNFLLYQKICQDSEDTLGDVSALCKECF